MRKIYLFFVLMLVAVLAGNGQTIRAVFFNPPSTDDGFEYLEIAHTPNTTLAGVTLIVIEGDGIDAGTVDIALDLSGYMTGNNGLLLIRDAASDLAPGPDLQTQVYTFNFIPDIENGANTYLLVTGFSGAAGNDLDTNNDGILDSTPWSSAIDGVACTDQISGDAQYADDLGFPNMPDISGNVTEALVKFDGVWYAVDIGTATNPGPYPVLAAWDVSGTENSALIGYYLAPGWTANPLTGSLLPVGLERFSAVPNHPKQVLLTFTTVSEQNNDRFEIERSADGRAFKTIGQVKGAGESQTRRNYTFTDLQPEAGANYYRLRQVDFDGAWSYSQVIAVKFGAIEAVVLYPSPVRDLLSVTWTSAAIPDWNIFAADGRLIRTGNNPVGTERLDIDVADLPDGAYFLQIVSNGFATVRQFVKN